MGEETRAVAIPTPGGSLVPEWWAAAYGPTCMYVTKLDTSRPEGRKQLLDAINDESQPKDDFINCDLELVNYVLQPASKEQDGEIVEFVRTVLILADGRRVCFGSRGIIKSLMLIEQLDRPAPWHPPLVKRLVTTKTAKGYIWPRLIDPPTTQKAPKGGPK